MLVPPLGGVVTIANVPGGIMFEINVFGSTTVRTPQGIVTASGMGGVKPRLILMLLALSAGTPVPKEHLADLLWDGRPPRSHLGTLESYVCVLRRSLGIPGGRGSAIATVNQGYLLDLAQVRVDLVEFRGHIRAARAAHDDHELALAHLEQAMELSDGELLAGEPYAAWAVQERDQVAQEVVAAATLAAGHALSLERPGVAARLARTALDGERLAEDAWQLLMRALWRSGRRPEALRAYAELRAQLSEELGTAPSPESAELYLEILRADGSGRRPSVDDAREELRALMALLREAVSAIPGVRAPCSDRAAVMAAAEFLAAS